jgi:hypothetical protein
MHISWLLQLQKKNKYSQLKKHKFNELSWHSWVPHSLLSHCMKNMSYLTFLATSIPLRSSRGSTKIELNSRVNALSKAKHKLRKLYASYSLIVPLRFTPQIKTNTKYNSLIESADFSWCPTLSYFTVALVYCWLLHYRILCLKINLEPWSTC